MSNWDHSGKASMLSQLFKTIKLVNMTPSQITALEHAGVKVEDAEGKLRFEFIDIIKPEPMRSPKSNIEYVDPLEEATKLPDYNKVGNIIDVYLAWRGGNYMIKMFFPSVKKPSRREVQIQMHKVYPGAKLYNYQVSSHDPGEPILQTTRG